MDDALGTSPMVIGLSLRAALLFVDAVGHYGDLFLFAEGWGFRIHITSIAGGDDKCFRFSPDHFIGYFMRNALKRG